MMAVLEPPLVKPLVRRLDGRSITAEVAALLRANPMRSFNLPEIVDILGDCTSIEVNAALDKLSKRNAVDKGCRSETGLDMNIYRWAS